MNCNLWHSHDHVNVTNCNSYLNNIFIKFVAPSGLRGCKNRPTPFPGLMSYKVTKPGIICLSYLSMFFIVLLFIRAPFYVLLVFVAMCSVFWLFFFKLLILAK